MGFSTNGTGPSPTDSPDNSSLAEQLSAQPQPAPPASVSMAARAMPDLSKLPQLNSGPKSQAPISWLKSEPPTSSQSSAPSRLARVSKFFSLENPVAADLTKCVNEIKKSTKVSIETSKGASGSTTVLLNGSPVDVENARRRLVSQLAPKVSKRLVCVETARSTVIGVKGSNLKTITAETQARIEVGQPVKEHIGVEWEMSIVNIDLSGPSEAVERASDMITQSLGPAHSAITAIRTPVDKKMSAFMDLFVAKLKDNLDLSISSTRSNQLKVTGILEQVERACTLIDDYISSCSSTFVAVTCPTLEGNLLSERHFFESHHVVIDGNCLYGPADNVADANMALDRYLEKLHTLQLDISRAHGGDRDHASVVALFLEKRGALKALEKSSGAKVISPASTGKPRDLTYYITAEDASSAQSAKRQLIDVVNAVPPHTVLRLPGLTSDITNSRVQKALVSSNDEHIYPIVHEDGVFLFYIGSNDDFAPSPGETTTSLQTFARKLDPIYAIENELVEREIALSKQDQSFIRQPLEPFKKRLDELVSRDGELAMSLSWLADKLVVVGLNDNVAEFCKELPKVVTESKDYLQRSNYKVEFKVDPAYIKNIIGRNGSNISKLRSNFDVKIDIADTGDIVVKGTEENATKVKDLIRSQAKRLQDEVTETLEIPHQFHSLLIGTNGRSVRRMKEKYDVFVQFPSERQTLKNSGNFRPNSIVLQGPSSGVKKATKEYLDLVEYEKSHSHESIIEVPSQTFNKLLSHNRGLLNDVRETTDTRVSLDREKYPGQVCIVIQGTATGALLAEHKIKTAVSEALDRVDLRFNVDKVHHRYIIGNNNAVKNALVEDALKTTGSTIPPALHVPPLSNASTELLVTGSSKAAEHIKARIFEIVNERENAIKFEDFVSVPVSQIRRLVGVAGSSKRDIEKRFDITMEIPSSNSGRDKAVHVVIRAPSEAKIIEAKAYLEEFLSLGELSLQVPATVIGDVYNSGSLARILKDEFGIVLNVKGTVSAAAEQSLEAPTTLEKQPVILEYEKIVPYVGAVSKTLTWTLSSKKQSDCESAANLIRKLVLDAESFDTMARIWFSSAASYSKAIGRAGVFVNATRKQTGTAIYMPHKSQGTSAPIVIRGVKAQVERAAELIIKEAGFENN